MRISQHQTQTAEGTFQIHLIKCRIIMVTIFLFLARRDNPLNTFPLGGGGKGGREISDFYSTLPSSCDCRCYQINVRDSFYAILSASGKEFAVQRCRCVQVDVGIHSPLGLLTRWLKSEAFVASDGNLSARNWCGM